QEARAAIPELRRADRGDRFPAALDRRRATRRRGPGGNDASIAAGATRSVAGGTSLPSIAPREITPLARSNGGRHGRRAGARGRCDRLDALRRGPAGARFGDRRGRAGRPAEAPERWRVRKLGVLSPRSWRGDRRPFRGGAGP